MPPILPLEDPDRLLPTPTYLSEAEMGDLLAKSPEPLPLTKRVLFLGLGATLLAVGTVVWVLPVLFGAPIFWLAGLICLSRASDRTRRAVNFADRKLPRRLRGWLRWARDKAHRHAPQAVRGENGSGPSTADSSP